MLRPADDLPGVNLPLKLCGNLRKLPVDGLLTPTFRNVPPAGQVRLSPAPADPDFIEVLPGLCLLYTSDKLAEWYGKANHSG